MHFIVMEVQDDLPKKDIHELKQPMENGAGRILQLAIRFNSQVEIWREVIRREVLTCKL